MIIYLLIKLIYYVQVLVGINLLYDVSVSVSVFS